MHEVNGIPKKMVLTIEIDSSIKIVDFEVVLLQ